MALGPEDAAQRRACLRLFTYGLHAVTVRRGNEHSAFTATWLTQVSFNPPLIALSVENNSRSIGMIRDTGIFTVNVLPSGSTNIAGALGRRFANVPDKLAQIAWSVGPNGCAVLECALSYLACAVERSVPAGDSTLFVARITAAHGPREGAPLTMAETPFKHSG